MKHPGEKDKCIFGANKKVENPLFPHTKGVALRCVIEVTVITDSTDVGECCACHFQSFTHAKLMLDADAATSPWVWVPSQH